MIRKSLLLKAIQSILTLFKTSNKRSKRFLE